MGEYEFLHFPAEAVHVDPVRYGQLPDSAQRVFGAVRAEGPLTHTELRDATGLPARTIRFAVKRLKDEGFVDARCSLKDCRTCYFFVSKDCVGTEALEEARVKAQEASRMGRLVEQM
jgi:DNA-binding transcriptional regulator GbsR (MarR family)